MALTPKLIATALTIVGVTAAAIGVALIYFPAALILIGVGLAAGGLFGFEVDG